MVKTKQPHTTCTIRHTCLWNRNQIAKEVWCMDRKTPNYDFHKGERT